VSWLAFFSLFSDFDFSWPAYSSTSTNFFSDFSTLPFLRDAAALSFSSSRR